MPGKAADTQHKLMEAARKETIPCKTTGVELPKTMGPHLLHLHDLDTAAEYVKSRLPEALKQHLQDYEKDKENSVLSYQTILEQQILSIDREMLEKLTVSYDEAAIQTLPHQRLHLTDCHKFVPSKGAY
ncbi:Protein phosphatase 1L [Plecturocebus cupreus]